jgi:hypothetical protein
LGVRGVAKLQASPINLTTMFGGEGGATSKSPDDFKITAAVMASMTDRRQKAAAPWPSIVL